MKNQTWGGRFEKALDPAAAQFNASIGFDHSLYKHDIRGSCAHAKMLANQKLISEEESKTIIAGLQEIERELDQNLHVFDERFEDIHMFIEHILLQKIGETAKKLHTGRSRNDQVALDLRLFMRDNGDTIRSLLSELITYLGELEHTHAQDLMPGYTHMQQAQPVPLGRHLGAYKHMFARDQKRLQNWREIMNYSPLGSGALAGSSLPLDRHFVAKELGFNGIIENTMDAVSDRDFVIEFFSFASIVMMHLSRLCEDLIIWATQEFNFITIEDNFATGSSLMPNKKNPDILELIRGKSGRVFGDLIAILTLMKGLPLTYNKDMQEDKEAVFDVTRTLISCLGIITPFLKNVRFNLSLMKDKTETGYLYATKMLEELVIKGVPFRDAHHIVGSWVKEAIQKDVPLNQIRNQSISKHN